MPFSNHTPRQLLFSHKNSHNTMYTAQQGYKWEKIIGFYLKRKCFVKDTIWYSKNGVAISTYLNHSNIFKLSNVLRCGWHSGLSKGGQTRSGIYLHSIAT